MAKSQIIITQTAYGSSAAGEAMRGLDLYSVGSEAIVFSNSADGNTGVTKWEWTLVERPPGSIAMLQGSDSSEASIQADISGRYVVSLRVNDLGNSTSGYSVTVAGVSYPTYRSSGGTDYGDWDLPAFSEGISANWTDKYGANNPYGAQRELYRIISDLREYYIPTAFDQYKLIRFNFAYAPVNSRALQVTTVAVPAAYSALLDMSDYDYGVVKFGVVLRRSVTATAYAKLKDHTHGGDITNSEVSTTSTNPVTLISSALTVGNGVGEVRLTPTMYEIEIRRTGTGAVYIYDAFLLLDA